ncbi:hypothetical protein OROGR_001111 [Orobanche gracilis]
MEGHAMTCKIAQGMLEPEVAHAVQMLLPDYVNEWDCHDPHGSKDMCVAGAITNFTNQLSHYRHRTADRHSNACQVLDKEIILTAAAAADFYDKDLNLMQEDIEGNITYGIWSGDLVSWGDCSDIFSSVDKGVNKRQGSKKLDIFGSKRFDSEFGLAYQTSSQTFKIDIRLDSSNDSKKFGSTHQVRPRYAV